MLDAVLGKRNKARKNDLFIQKKMKAKLAGLS
jgi:hypothetical protein